MNQVAPKTVSLRAIGLLFVATVVVWVCDYLSKEWVVANFRLGESRPVLGDALTFHYVLNPGAAFSFASGQTWIFTILATAVCAFIVFQARRLRSLGWAAVLGVLLGGVLGNLFDRLFRPPGAFVGHVVDFISVWGFPAIFNVADIAITTSMGVFMILVLRGIRLDGRRHVDARAAEEEEPQQGKES